MIGDLTWARDLDAEFDRQFRQLADQDFTGRKPADPDKADSNYGEDAHER